MATSKFMFRLGAGCRLLLASLAWLVCGPVITANYLARSLTDWLLTQAASRRPGPGDIVLITGASSGIGLSAALCLHRRGFHVLAGVRNQASFNQLKRAGLQPVFLDVNNTKDIAKAVQTVESACGNATFAALISNAGVCFPAPLEAQPEDDVRAMIDTNLLGPALITRAFLPLLRRHKARVVFVGSVSGTLPLPAVSIYTATKYGVRGLALSLAQELRPFGISVSVVEPGQTATPILDKAQAALDAAPAPSEYGGLVRLVEFYTKALVRIMSGDPARTTDLVICEAVMGRRPPLQVRSSWMASLQHYVSEFPAEIGIGELVSMAYRTLYGIEPGWSAS